MPSLAASHSVGRTDPPMNSMVQTGHVMMNVIIYESNKEVYIMIIYTRVVITLTPVGRVNVHTRVDICCIMQCPIH